MQTLPYVVVAREGVAKVYEVCTPPIEILYIYSNYYLFSSTGLRLKSS